MSLKDKVLFITGASRGIGLAIALRAAKDGGCIAVAAKTDTPHPRLPGTIHTAAEEIRRAGGKALPLVCDIRNEEAIKAAIQKTVDTFGGIDIVVNNASAISLTDTQDTPIKKFNLMFEINSRGTWLVTKHAIPHLIESGRKNRNPHILNLSPPLLLKEDWFKNHVAYSMAKYNMSLCVLGWAAEFRDKGIAANALWPLTVIETSAIKMLDSTKQIDSSFGSNSRTPEIMADAAHVILTKNSKEFSGNFVIDEVILRENGQTKFDHYSTKPGANDMTFDLFVDDKIINKMRALWGSKL
ncbi:10571_t:CDS:10 [Cetraspora pellucida]|uniref:Hydroxysteroid dehydrogenase-like protein 2 n=1 Tax=Cetraspora pellucida TaxID=1433469 RepID=A0A9N8ZUL4_9GLOM|nr:10571_t:CDS:10 [Cetraspora pellucida]